jgi:hypothetical protein
MQDDTGQIFRENGSFSQFDFFIPEARRACVYQGLQAFLPGKEVG